MHLESDAARLHCDEYIVGVLGARWAKHVFSLVAWVEANVSNSSNRYRRSIGHVLPVLPGVCPIEPIIIIG